MGAWNEIWKGALQAVGALVVAVIVARVATWVPAVRSWLSDHVGTLVAPGRIDLTFFLAIACVCLLALFVTSRSTLYRLRRRIVENRLTLGDMAGGKCGVEKALDDFDEKLRRPNRT